MSLLCLILLALPALAAESLQTIEVTASKDNSAYTFTQTEDIPSEELERAPLPLVSQILERVPGLVSSQNGGPGGRTTFFIRGTEARHISFTLDGLKLNDPSNTDRQFDAAFLSLTGIDEILVHKGAPAVLYGSDALGGHVEMKTRKGSENPEKKLVLSAGSFGTLGASYRQDWKKGTVSLIRQRSDGISRLNKKRYGATERDASEITQLMSSSRHDFSEKLRTDLLGSFIEGRNELDGTTDTSKNTSQNHQYLLQQKTRYQLRKNSALSLRNGLNRHERQVKGSSGTTSYSGNLYQNEILWEIGGEERKLLSGVALDEETLLLSEKRAVTVASAFSQGVLKDGPASFQLGLRGDQHSRFGSFLTGSTGVSLETSIGTWSVQYAHGYKSPSLYQLYAPPYSGQPKVGNRDLNPESNQSYEARWKKKWHTWELENVFFVNRLSNLIVFTTAGGYQNQGRFIAEGVEPSVKWTNQSLEVRGSFTHQRFRDETSPILRRPLNMGQVRTSWFVGDAHELYATMRWFGARKDIDLSEKIVKLNGFETVDLGGVYRWKTQEVSLQIQNLLDREYEEVYGFSVMPRSVFGSYGVKF